MPKAAKVGTILVLFIILAVPTVDAHSGCCSHHGGVCGCGCCDGTPLSNTCAPYYPQCNAPGTTTNTTQENQVAVPTVAHQIVTYTSVPTATEMPIPTATPTRTITPMQTNTPTPKLKVPAKKISQPGKQIKTQGNRFWAILLQFFHFF